MSHYQQRLILEASPAATYVVFTTPEGLRGWRACKTAISAAN
jgi:hypothetical protein